MKDFSYITNSHPSFIEGMYQQFVQDPLSIDPELKKFFEGFDFAMQNGAIVTTSNPTQNETSKLSQENNTSLSSDVNLAKEIAVYRLILGYRNKGHLIAKTNPIRERKDRHANLDLHFFGLSEADLNTNFYAGNFLGLGATSLKNIVAHLQNVYAKNIGIEFKYISDQEKVSYFRKAFQEVHV